MSEKRVCAGICFFLIYLFTNDDAAQKAESIQRAASSADDTRRTLAPFGESETERNRQTEKRGEDTERGEG